VDIGTKMVWSEGKGTPTRDKKLAKPIAAACRQPIKSIKGTPRPALHRNIHFGAGGLQ